MLLLETWTQTLLRLASSRRQGRSPQPMAFDCAPPVCCSGRHASGKIPRQVTGLSSAIQCFISRDVDQTLLQLASSRRQGRTTRPLTFDCAPPVCCSGCHASGKIPRQVTGRSSAFQCFISRDVDQTLLQLASNRRQGRSPRLIAFDCALASPLLRLPHVREDSSTSDRGLSSAIQCFIARDVDSNPAPTCKQPTPGKIPSANGIRLCTASLLLRLPRVREDFLDK